MENMNTIIHLDLDHIDRALHQETAENTSFHLQMEFSK
jgi:hypothetical protein